VHAHFAIELTRCVDMPVTVDHGQMINSAAPDPNS